MTTEDNNEKSCSVSTLLHFGCKKTDSALLKLFENVTGKKPHRLLRRGIYCCHFKFDRILQLFKEKKPFYLYTGRCPSGKMNLDRYIPFIFTKYLQDIFKCPLVIQLNIDEKFIFQKELSIEAVKKATQENIKDIIACGFDLKRTFIFDNFGYIDKLYPISCQIQKLLSVNKIKKCFGFDMSDNIGKWSFPSIQIASAFSQSFSDIIVDPFEVTEMKIKGIPCLIPASIDQDVYFRLAREVSPHLGFQKPSCIYSQLMPELKNDKKKDSAFMMSTSDPEHAIFLNDDKKTIERKINQAHSGGAMTKSEQEKNGANLDEDVAYQYLRFFLEDDAELERIKKKYGPGSMLPGEKKMLTGEVKKILIKILQDKISEFQKRRKEVTDEVVNKFMTRRKLEFKKE